MFDTTARASWTSLLVGGAVLASVAGMLPPALRAGAASCEVRNATTGGSSSSDLQQMIDAADAGDVLEVQGVCVGGFVIDKSLTVRRHSTEQPAVLDANRTAAVITVTGLPDQPVPLRLKLSGMTLRNGRGEYGGGISAQFTDLRISHSLIRDSVSWYGNGGGGIWAKEGDTSLTKSVVRDNRAPHQDGGGVWTNGPLRVSGSSIVGNSGSFGGGIYTNRLLLLTRDSYVGGNRAQSGGGIWSEGATTILQDRAHVAGNESYAWGGGGITSWGRVLLRDWASIRDNVTSDGGPIRGEGAGLRCRGCVVRLSSHASIVNNKSASRGGGIHGGTIVMTQQARIANNQAVQGAGVYLDRPTSLRMEGGAKIVRNTARADGACDQNACQSRGGGVYASRYGERLARIIVRDDAAIVHNRPDNIFRERG